MNINIYIYYIYPRTYSSPSAPLFRVNTVNTVNASTHREVGLELLHGSSDHLILQGIGKGEAQLDATPGTRHVAAGT